MRSVHIVAIGDELRTGTRQDTNGSWMARRLTSLGVPPRRLHIAGDDPNDVAALLRALADEADLIVLCGGLGPTGDDTTRAALSLAMGVSLVEHPAAWTQVQHSLRARALEPNAMRRTQALVPEGAQPLGNDVGTAPGIQAQLGGATIVALPGVPREMKPMFDTHVAPLLPQSAVPARGSVWVACVPEADIAATVEALGAEGVSLAYYAHHGEVEVVVSGADAERVSEFSARARSALGAAAFDGGPGGRIQHAVVHGLRDAGATVATVESLTGGGIAQALTEVPGASAVLGFGWVVYSIEAKVALGVPKRLIEADGVVSSPVALSLAEAARAHSGATYSIATTGVAGPGDFTDAQGRTVPAGRVHIAVAGPSGVKTEVLSGPRTRDGVRRAATVRALDLLRRTLSSDRSEAPGRFSS